MNHNFVIEVVQQDFPSATTAQVGIKLSLTAADGTVLPDVLMESPYAKDIDVSAGDYAAVLQAVDVNGKELGASFSTTGTVTAPVSVDIPIGLTIS